MIELSLLPLRIMASPEQSLARDRVPHTLLGQVEFFKGEDRWFYAVIAPHLLSAFVKWQDNLLAAGVSQDLIRKQQESDDYTTLMAHLRANIYYLSDGMIDIGGGVDDNERFSEDPTAVIKEVIFKETDFFYAQTHFFYANITMPEVSVWPQGLVEKAYKAWQMMLNYDAWKWPRAAMGVPLAFKFPENMGEVYGLPSKIDFGEFSLEFSFNKYYLPSFVRYPPYVQNFFNYIAREYENIVPLEFKKTILSRLFSFVGPGRVLDIGSGTGLASEQTPEQVNLIGVDIAKEMLALAKEREEEVFGADVHFLPLTNESVDHAIMSFGEYWVYNFPLVTKEVFRVLRPGGRFAFNIHKPAEDRQDAYKDLCTKSGFKDVNFFEESIERQGELPYQANYLVVTK